VTMVIAAILIDLLFSALGLIPENRPTTNDVFGSIQLDYKLALNVAATVVFAALMWLTVRRGSADPVCGMTVDRGKARTVGYEGRTYYFCSEHCESTFAADPPSYAH